jgi:hypothetical protein
MSAYLQPVLSARHQHEVAARLRQAVRARLPDAAARARHQRRLPRHGHLRVQVKRRRGECGQGQAELLL